VPLTDFLKSQNTTQRHKLILSGNPHILYFVLWKLFTDDATPPKWIKQKKKPEITPGQVTVTGFLNGWCPAGNMVFERAKRAASEFGDKVVFQKIDTKFVPASTDALQTTNEAPTSSIKTKHGELTEKTRLWLRGYFVIPSVK
jgi:thiol-disulfide isomerase/thioredoxin